MHSPTIAILCNTLQRQLLEQSIQTDAAQFIWFDAEASFTAARADFFVAMLPIHGTIDPAKGKWLINQTEKTLAAYEFPENAMVARFCGWPTFWERPLWEVAVTGPDKNWIHDLATCLGKTFELVKDVPGLMAPAVVACIINEAYYAMAEGICSASDLDKAMMLGTNYPIGPLEWAAKIHPAAVGNLLNCLESGDGRFKPHPHLLEGVVYG